MYWQGNVSPWGSQNLGIRACSRIFLHKSHRVLTEKTGKKNCIEHSLWCSPGRGKGQPLQVGPKLHPLSYYGAKAFICLGTGNKYNQTKDTGKNPLQVGKEGKGAGTPLKGKRIYVDSEFTCTWAGELSRPHPQ